jgi:hypothetical protein
MVRVATDRSCDLWVVVDASQGRSVYTNRYWSIYRCFFCTSLVMGGGCCLLVVGRVAMMGGNSHILGCKGATRRAWTAVTSQCSSCEQC